MTTKTHIPFVRDMAFEYGRPDQVSPRIRRLVAKNPGPFTFLGTGVYIIGRGEVAVIDPGPDDVPHREAVWDALEGEQVTHVLVTHHHADHSPLARPLARAHGCKVYGRLVETRAPDASEPQTEAGHDLGFRPDVEVQDGDRFEGPDWTIEALHTPGHTSNHVCFALEEENALFTGDHIMGWSTSVISPPDGDMGAYFASLEKVRARGFDRLWPTHGPPVTDPDPFIAAYIAHRRDRERQILDQIAAGRATIREMVPVMYADVDARLYPAAARSVLAHLIHMVERGAIACDGPADLGARYRLA